MKRSCSNTKKCESALPDNYFSMLSQWQLRHLLWAWCENWKWSSHSHIYSLIFIIDLFPVTATLQHLILIWKHYSLIYKFHC